MQKFAVVFFPKINVDQINSFRQKYDPHWYIIPPHITIVSPVLDLSETMLIEHVERVAKEGKFFSIHVTGLTRTSDDCLFLLVKEGNDEIVNLHNKLYSGILASYLPTDISFTPHM